VRTVNVAWDRGAERFIAQGTHRGSELAINAPENQPDPAGTHRRPTGFSASELLLAGVGSCSAWDIVEIMRKQRQQMTGLDVAVSGEQHADPPWAYQRIEIRFTVRGHDLDEERVRRAVRLSVDNYCSVIASLRSAEIIDSVEIIQEDAAPAA
jgi:putative redox protein